MKYKFLIIIFISIFPVFCFGQDKFFKNGFSTGVVLPVSTPYEQSYIGFGVSVFGEIGLFDKVSIYSGTGMYVFLTHKSDRFNNRQHEWLNFDYMFDVGPKIYFGKLYTKLGCGFIWGESFRLTFIPSFGIRHNLLDIGIGYHYSHDYTFFEVRVGVYTF